MARAKMPGLQLRGGVWWIWKQVNGYGRIRASTGYREGDYAKAEHVLIRRLNEINDAQRLGIRPQRVFREAGAKFWSRTRTCNDRGCCPDVTAGPYIGHLPSRTFTTARWRRSSPIGVLVGLQPTINIAIARCAGSFVWRQCGGATRTITWLAVPPSLTMLNEQETRVAYPLTWEQQRIFAELPGYLHRMALFKVILRREEVSLEVGV
jgi:hypothetical protein